MDIEGAGWKVLAQLLEKERIRTRGDFFRLTLEQLESLDRFGRKSAENLKAAIDRARHRPLHRIIYALGIPQVGEQTAIDLATWIGRTWPPRDDEPMGGPDGWLSRVATGLDDSTPDQFEEVAGVGPTVGASIAAYFADPATAGVLHDLVDAGVEPERPPPQVTAAGAGPLDGKTLVVTGTLEGFDRPSAEAAIRQAGGKPAGSVVASADAELAAALVDFAEARVELRTGPSLMADGSINKSRGAPPPRSACDPASGFVDGEGPVVADVVGQRCSWVSR